MTLSIVIVSWNTQDLLQRCISSILKYPPKQDYEIVVVDNASRDGSVQMLHDLFPGANVICNSENLGFSQATNQGIHTCLGTHILLLNPDTKLKPKALNALERVLIENPSIGATGARLLNADGTIQPSCFRAPTLFREIWRLFHLDNIYPLSTYQLETWDKQKPREVEVLNGACLMLKREALDDAGYLDETYFMYSEEVDLCYRLRRTGWKLFWVPEAEVVHYGGQSTRQNQSEMFQQLYRSKILYFRKNHGRMAAGIYKVILIAASSVRLILIPLTLFNRLPKRQERLGLANNYWQLLAAIPRM